MVIYGLTRYLESSHELGSSPPTFNSSSMASKSPRITSLIDDSFTAPVRIFIAANQLNANGQIKVHKTGPGVSYWSVDSHCYTADKKLFHQGEVNLNITRDYYILKKRQDKPTDAITYDLVPLSGPVHVGDIIAVKLADQRHQRKNTCSPRIQSPLAPSGLTIPSSTSSTTNLIGGGWWFTRREFHDDRAAYFETDFGGRREYVNLLKVVTPGKFVISPAQSGPMYQPNIQTTTEPANLEVLP